MSLWDRLTGEFIDVIEWTTDDADTMVYRFERHGNEIKYGAKLTVREGQVAVFINEGQLADVFPPGMYMLETNNMPLMTTLNSWGHGFNSPFKAEVYFVAVRSNPPACIRHVWDSRERRRRVYARNRRNGWTIRY